MISEYIWPILFVIVSIAVIANLFILSQRNTSQTDSNQGPVAILISGWVIIAFGLFKITWVIFLISLLAYVIISDWFTGEKLIALTKKLYWLLKHFIRQIAVKGV